MKSSRMGIIFIMCLTVMNSCNEREAELNNSTVEEYGDDSYVSINELSESDILKAYESAMSSKDYAKAGNDILQWLKVNSSDDVSSRLDYLKEHIYTSGYTCTVYDEESNVDYTSRFEFNDKSDVIREEYGTGNQTVVSYSYSHSYNGDTCIMSTCCNEDGDILYTWEAEVDDSNNILSETRSYNNLSTAERIEHNYNESGLCINEHLIYSGEEGVSSEQFIDYEYDDNGYLVNEKKYNGDEALFEEVTYTYDEFGDNVKIEYVNSEGDTYLVYTYEYDKHGNVLNEYLEEGDHNEEYRYTYDRFGSMRTKQYYQHDELISDTTFDCDFLGNVLLDTTIEGGVETVKIYNYEYSFRE